MLFVHRSKTRELDIMKEDYVLMDKEIIVEKIMAASGLTKDEAINALEITLERLRAEGKIE